MIKKFTKSSSATPAPLPSYIPPSLNPPTPPLPRLIVFDLDYTLWPFWVDTHPMPPFRAASDHTSASDKTGETYEFYPDSGPILYSLGGHLSIKVAAASRTHAPELARDLLKMLWVYPPPLPSTSSASTGEDGSTGSAQQSYSSSKKEKPRKAMDFFDAGLEIYPGSKIRHFETLHRKTGIAYDEMLFFDDESRNRDVESLGVTMWLVRDGMTWSELEDGVKEWRRRKGHV
ncbi:hypothetical protein jhhlp_005927 [Lomentospora prolificans]|uniref:Magnesium-dependent phosphatase-1 n=1 Tax=Lomentospora prolificans TaxID=41688 RepID=A0A2N3N4G9_9PEZI|nr:hypothetical protein jhhlp_005927 [Lomentospora prolificans]